MAPCEYEEKTITGRFKEVKDRLRQAVLEGWAPYLQAGMCGNGGDNSVSVFLVRPKQPQLRKQHHYTDPDDLDRSREV